MSFTIIRAMLVAACIAAMIGSAHGQAIVYDWIAPQPSDWNVDANWVGLTLNFVPNADNFPGESARVNNGGTAIVEGIVPLVAALNVANGVVDIRNGGAVETIDDGVNNGALSIGGAGTINVSGNGRLTVDTNTTNAGQLRITGPNAVVEIGGNFTNTGRLTAAITDANDHGAVSVGGVANLSGTLQVAISGVTPTFGQTWDVLTAASVSGNFAAVDASASPSLARGLQYQVRRNGGTVSLNVTNTLMLSVDRQTGAGFIENPIGDPIEITGYAIRSANGLLSVDDWMSVTESNLAGAGWRVASPTANQLAELNLRNSFGFSATDSVDLGNPYDGGPAKPFEEDLLFEYTTPDGRLQQGIVEYTGAINDLVLFVDPDNGDAALGNLSRFIETPIITSYAVRSPSGALNASNWTSLTGSGEAGSGWREANPDSTHLAELNLSSSTELPNGTLFFLGNIFTPGSTRDLFLEYTTPGGELLLGSIQYGDIPVPMAGLIGDYNNGGQVEQGDLDLVLLNWGQTTPPVPNGWTNDLPEGLIDQAELDKVLLSWGNSAAALSIAAIPEPSTCLLALTVLILVGAKSNLLRRCCRTE